MSELLNRSQIILKTTEHIKELHEGEGTGHDWWHIKRVRDMALYLAEQENADPFIVELAALLHDIADHKFHGGNEEIGPKKAAEWLRQFGVSEEIILKVTAIVREVSFKGANVSTEMSSLEGKIVQDADRLDALGAIGTGRAFAYGGHKDRPMFDPQIKPVMHDTFEAYKNEGGPTLNHFYEKLFLLKDRMNTSAAKKIAQERHQFMEIFVDTFIKEWYFNKKPE